jgi:ABC-2 type transport system permease protein
MRWLPVKAVARRHAYMLWRSPPRVFDVSVWPFVDVLLFGSLANFVRNGTVSAATGYLLSGIILWHVVYQAQIGVATGLMEETWSRQMLSLMVAPITELEYVAGVALFGLVKLVIGVGVVALATVVMFGFDLTSLGWGFVPIAAILLVVGWSIALGVMGLILRYGSGAEILTWGIMFIVISLSGIFYPVEALPGAIQPISLALPSTHALTAARGLVDGRGMDWGQMTIAAGGTVVTVIVMLAYVRWMLATFRRRGFVTRYS